MPNAERKRKKWDAESMKKAVTAVREKKMGFLKASKSFNVPKSTLEDYVKNKEKDVEELCKIPLGRRCVLGAELEEELVLYCQRMEERFFGVTERDLKQLAFQLAVKYNIEHPFPLAKSAAGEKWIRNFLKRHPNLSMRKPQSMALARAKGFSKENVTLFYDLLEPELRKVKMKPHRVYNVDETGITVVQSRRLKVIAVKGKKQIGTLSAQERGALMTLVTCMSPSGIFVPPLIIFPRQNMKPELLDGTPPGTIGRCHKSGWIQAHIFTEWLQHFIDCVKPTLKDPVVLVLDGHETHVRNINVILKASENGVIIVCIPPHTSHKLKPMDVAFMSPFKAYYSQEVETWLSNNPFRALTSYQIGELMGKAYAKAATLQIATSGFRKCGIIPFDRNRFQESDFLPIEDREDETEQTSMDIDLEGQTLPRSAESLVSPSTPSGPHFEASTSHTSNTSPTTPVAAGKSSKKVVSPFLLKPLPKLPGKSSNPKRGHPAGKTAVVTSSPYKKNLEDQIERSNVKEKKFQDKNKQQISKMAEKMAKQSSNANEKESKKSYESRKKTCNKQLLFKKGTKAKAKPPPKCDSSDDDMDIPYVSTDDEDSADEECVYCCQPYKHDAGGEQWIRCTCCLRWAHELCSGYDEKGWKTFTCDFCSQR